ncbi:HetP protein [Halothece sp. PCC 7418]|uniref:HetP family heterocyst commitment protein n=1 Tax=Halothece sp. (strain PCC 7418) TaxID=65093 RepID=UPI0002A074AA|nr:HetP family heterocyst commitment protein [Halothece sp. PCC 7418]AFZ43299.1 HetP protein [Halothece sp. PCC 7418]
MSYQKSSFNEERNPIMSEEKFDQIIDAILAGKYSWACVLVLETAGYNPLHYIPYRTYNRLIKNNCTTSPSDQQSKIQPKQTKNSNCSSSSTPHIKDLNYVKQTPHSKVKGGRQPYYSTKLISYRKSLSIRL